MKNKVVLFVTIVVCFLLQCTVLKSIAIGSISPNLLLILCVSIGLIRGKRTGLWVGFFTGILMDLFYGNLFGFNALMYMYIGYFSGYAYRIYYDDDVKVPVLMVTCADFLYGIVFYILQFLLRGRTDFLFYLRRIIIPEILYTLILTLIVYRIFYHISHRYLETDRKDRERLWLPK